jgi:hypothetical protein
MQNGYEFPEKMENITFFFNQTSGPIFMLFLWDFTFFIGDTDKTDSFQELCND